MSEDRPRPKPSKRVPEGAFPCCECGLVFQPTERPAGRRARDENIVWEAKRGRDFLVRDDGSIVCKERPACRRRRLYALLGVEIERPAWLFLQYPRDRLLVEVDPRPPNWRATGWLPRSHPHERLRAAILYSSWSYPVCMEYAVQLAGTCPHPARRDTDPDEILRDEHKRPRPLREKDLAHWLNEHPNNVSRALKRLQIAKEIRLDEDHVIYPAAKLLDMSVAERQALYAQELIAADEQLKGVPVRFRRLLSLIQQHCSAELSTDIFARVRERCTRFNDQLRDIRTERDSGIQKECSRGTILIPDFQSCNRPTSSSKSLPSPPIPPHSKTQPVETGESSTLNALYEAGLGDGALAKLPPKDERAVAYLAVQLDKARLAHRNGALLCLDDELVGNLASACLTVAPDCTAAEILAATVEKLPQILAGKNPAGLLTVAVPKHLSGGGLARIRSRLQAEQQMVDRAAVSNRELEAKAEAENRTFDLLQRLDRTWSEMTTREREQRIQKHLDRLAVSVKNWKGLPQSSRRALAEDEALKELQSELASQGQTQTTHN